MLQGTCHCGALSWNLEGDPGSITACNCTLCRRYGALWAYDYEDERIRISGPSSVYTRPGKADPALEIHFCQKKTRLRIFGSTTSMGWIRLMICKRSNNRVLEIRCQT